MGEFFPPMPLLHSVSLSPSGTDFVNGLYYFSQPRADEKILVGTFWWPKKKIVCRLTRDDGHTLLRKRLIRRPPGDGRGILACDGGSLDLSEIVFGDRLSLNNRTIMT